jgi:hypothetical protein
MFSLAFLSFSSTPFKQRERTREKADGKNHHCAKGTTKGRNPPKKRKKEGREGMKGCEGCGVRSVMVVLLAYAVGCGCRGTGVGMDWTGLDCAYDVKREKKRLRVADTLLQ